MEVHWKIQFFGESIKKQDVGRGLPKGGAWTACRFKRGLGKKRNAVFEGGWYSKETMEDFKKWGELSNGWDDFEMGGWYPLWTMYFKTAI